MTFRKKIKKIKGDASLRVFYRKKQKIRHQSLFIQIKREEEIYSFMML